MVKGKVAKLVGLNISIIALNIILFSPGLIGIEIVGGSTFQTALGFTILFMSIVVFCYGNYKLLTQERPKIQTTKIENEFDCISALKENSYKKVFSRDIEMILEQINRLNKKKVLVNDLLLEKFDKSEMSYSKFKFAIDKVEELFFINVKSVINKLSIFDEEDYDYVRKDYASSRISEDIIIQKMSIYNEYIAFVKDSVEDNEAILLKLDKLLLELSKFNSLEDGELENMSTMKEIDDLISKTKYYK